MSSVATTALPTTSLASPMHALTGNLGLQKDFQSKPAIFMVEDDSDTRKVLDLLIGSQDWQLRTCESASEFLAGPRPNVSSSLILAISSMDSPCLEVQKRIARERPETPVIVIGGCVDIPTAVQAMKAGAIDFLVKPFREDQMLAAIRKSLTRSQATLGRVQEMCKLKSRYASLSAREQQVMALVSAGLLNKQVGVELGISEITVKAHRGQVMQKMKADSFAHLVNMALRLGITKCVLPSSSPSEARWAELL